MHMISKDWPSTEGNIERITSPRSSLLFIIDSFDELNFAFEELELILCENWNPGVPSVVPHEELAEAHRAPSCSYW